MEGLVIPSENKVKVHLVAFTRPLKHITRSSPVLICLSLPSIHSGTKMCQIELPLLQTQHLVNVAPVLREKTDSSTQSCKRTCEL